jgi:chromatin remodeling complex protein RSC6
MYIITRDEFLHMTHSKIDSFKKAWSAVSTRIIDQKDKVQLKDSGKGKRKKGEQEEGEEDEQEGKNKKGKGQGKGKGKAKTVEDILISKAAKVKAKYLSVYGQCTAFVGAAKSDPQFGWISDENMAPIYNAQDALAKDTHIHIWYI